MLLDGVLDLVPGTDSRHPLDLLPGLEEYQCRYAADAQGHRRLRALVRVELGEGHLALVVLRERLECRREHPARSAPWRPAINHKLPRALDGGLEVCVRELNDVL